jgi:hypothetical protein
MDQQIDKKYYYINQRLELLKEFDEDAERWRPILVSQYGGDFSNSLLSEAREEFETLLPQIPYIGGEESWTGPLVESVRCLAFFKAMKKRGKTVEETGKILYDAILTQRDESLAPISSGKFLTPEQLMERRKRRAELSQQQKYPEGYIYEFILGDGMEFDYGYDFWECAAQRFYHAHDADEFLPFYCFLDFPKSKVLGLGLTRTMTLAEGHKKCNHRFKSGRAEESKWPPSFMTHE